MEVLAQRIVGNTTATSVTFVAATAIWTEAQLLIVTGNLR